MNRRAFFARLGGAFVAALASPDLAALLPHTAGSFGAPPFPRTFVITADVISSPLAFHRDAFAFAMRPFDPDRGIETFNGEGWSEPTTETLRKGDIITFTERNT